MKSIIAATLPLAFITLSCTTDSGDSFGPYYELTFADNVSAVVVGDSIHVTVLQVPVTSSYLQAIPFEVTEDPSLLDTVKMKLTVLYGGYSPTPTPTRQVEVQQDTVLLKYDRTAFHRGLAKGTGLNMVETSPRPMYYSIQHVEILRAPGRYVSFASRLLH